MILSWTDNATNATSYTVERCSGTTGVWGLIATDLPGTATSYTDKNVTAGTTYNYQVVAFAGTVASPFSSGRRPRCPRRRRRISPPRSPLHPRVSICRGPATYNATSYTVERSSGTDGRLDCRRQRPSGHGHQLRGQQRNGGDDLQLPGRGICRHAGVAVVQRGIGHVAAGGTSGSGGADESRRQGLRVSGGREPLVDQQCHQRDFLHGDANQRHDGHVDRHYQRPSGNGHELRGHERDGWGDLLLSGRSDGRYAGVAQLERSVGHGACRRPGGPDESFGHALPLPSATVILSWTDNTANATSYTVQRSSGTTGLWTRHRHEPFGYGHKLPGLAR